MIKTRKKRKKAKYKGKTVIIIVSITALNFIGVSHAYWNGSLLIENSIKTGEIDCEFDDLTENRQGELSVHLDPDNYTMNITGTVEPGYEETLDYFITNNSTIPVKLTEQNELNNDGVTLSNKLINDGVILNTSQELEIIEPKDKDKDKDNKINGVLEIEIPEQQGEYRFEIKLPYKQWNYE